MRCDIVGGCQTGEENQERPRSNFAYHTPALRGLDTKCVDGSQRGAGLNHGTRCRWNPLRHGTRYMLTWDPSGLSVELIALATHALHSKAAGENGAKPVTLP